MHRSIIVPALWTLIFCLTGLAGRAQQGRFTEVTADRPSLIPYPAEVKAGTGSILPDGRFCIGYGTANEEKIAGLFRDFLRSQYALDLPVRRIGKDFSGPVISFSEENYTMTNPEGYKIHVLPGRIVVSGKGAGLFYGLQTLMQLFSTNSGHLTPVRCMEISDTPRYRYRGLMLDVGLHFFPVPFIEKCIDLMASYKLNAFHWHLTEDQGWRIEIKRYPKLTSVGAYRAQTMIGNNFKEFDHTPYGGFYTQDEIRAVVAYAAARYITIIPEIELPGHCRSALAAYPELACGDDPGPFEVAQTWGIFDDVYCAGKESTFHFLEGVLTEVMDLFPGKYIHIGGDECPKDKWKQCKYCQQRIRDNHLKDEEDLQSYFIRRIERFVNAKGKRLIGWDEILEGGLAPNATVMSWRGTEGGIAAVKQGHDVVMAPNTAVYFDYGQGDVKQEPLTFNGYNPMPQVYGYDPTPAGLTPEQQQHISGVEACLWTEYMATESKVEYMLLPRLLALSEIAWTPAAKKDYAGFITDRLPLQLGILDRTSVLYRVPEPIGAVDSVLYGERFRVALRPSVSGAKVYYTLDGHAPRETDAICEKPLDMIIPEGEERVLKSIVITPSGKRSVIVTTLFKNNSKKP